MKMKEVFPDMEELKDTEDTNKESKEDTDLLQKKYDYVYQCYFRSNQLLFYFAGITVGIIISSYLRGD